MRQTRRFGALFVLLSALAHLARASDTHQVAAKLAAVREIRARSKHVARQSHVHNEQERRGLADATSIESSARVTFDVATKYAAAKSANVQSHSNSTQQGRSLAGESCSAHADCASGQYCDTNSECWSCSLCALFDNSITGSCPSCSATTTHASCTNHTGCASDEYCDTNSECWSCSICLILGDTYNGAACPSNCGSSSESTSIATTYFDTTCSSHSDCGSDEYCDAGNTCWGCNWCTILGDTVDGGACPTQCASSYAYIGTCMGHNQCDGDEYCDAYLQCDACANCAVYEDAYDGTCPDHCDGFQELNDVTISVSADENSFDLYGIVAAEDGWSTPEFNEVTCARFTVSVFGDASSVSAYILPAATLAEAIDADLTTAQFLARLSAASVATCESSDFRYGLCEGSTEAMISTTEYAFHIENGRQEEIVFSAHMEKCNGEAIGDVYTTTLDAQSGETSDPVSGLTCVEYTFTTTPGAQVSAGMITAAGFANLEASFTSEPTISQIISGFRSRAVSSSLCYPSDFVDGECSKSVSGLSANTEYVIAAGNEESSSVPLMLHFRECPTTVEVTTTTTVVSSAEITEAEANAIAEGLVRAATGTAYSSDLTYVVVPAYTVSGRQTFASTVTEADVKSAVATRFNVIPARVSVTVTASTRRRLLAGVTADYVIAASNRANANSMRARAADSAQTLTVGGVTGTVVTSAASTSATYTVTMTVPEEDASTVQTIVSSSTFEQTVATSIQSTTGNANIAVETGSTATITDIDAEVQGLRALLGLFTTSGVDRRGGVIISALFGVVAMALLQ